MKSLATTTFLAFFALSCDGSCRISIVSTANSADAATPTIVVEVVKPDVVKTVFEDAGVVNTAPKTIKTLVVGDSEAGRCKFRMNEVRRENETIIVEQRDGTETKFWANGAFHAALARHPETDNVVIFLGTNDFYRTMVPNVAPILDEIKEKHLKCVWVGPTSVQFKKWKINGLLKDAVSPTCTYVDTQEIGIPLWDGVHPTNAGVIKWLRAIWDVK